MMRYTAAQARMHLADLLNDAARGHTIVIERRGVRYTLRASRLAPRRGRRESTFEVVDPAIAHGRWTWSWSAQGLRFDRSRRGR